VDIYLTITMAATLTTVATLLTAVAMAVANCSFQLSILDYTFSTFTVNTPAGLDTCMM
jgi:hypothetical protein